MLNFVGAQDPRMAYLEAKIQVVRDEKIRNVVACTRADDVIFNSSSLDGAHSTQ